MIYKKKLNSSHIRNSNKVRKDVTRRMENPQKISEEKEKIIFCQECKDSGLLEVHNAYTREIKKVPCNFCLEGERVFAEWYPEEYKRIFNCHKDRIVFH